MGGPDWGSNRRWVEIYAAWPSNAQCSVDNRQAVSSEGKRDPASDEYHAADGGDGAQNAGPENRHDCQPLAVMRTVGRLGPWTQNEGNDRPSKDERACKDSRASKSMGRKLGMQRYE